MQHISDVCTRLSEGVARIPQAVRECVAAKEAQRAAQERRALEAVAQVGAQVATVVASLRQLQERERDWGARAARAEERLERVAHDVEQLLRDACHCGCQGAAPLSYVPLFVAGSCRARRGHDHHHDCDLELLLLRAVSAGRTNEVRRLLAAGVAADARDREDATPLHRAALRGFAGLAQLLLERGADAAATDAALRTPLHAAAAGDARGLCVSLLAERCPAAVNARDLAGETPLHVAAARANAAAVRALLRAGADADATDALGRKPVEVATSAEIRQLFM